MNSITYNSNITRGQANQLEALFNGAMLKGCSVGHLDKRAINYLLEHGGELQGFVIEAMLKLSVSNKLIEQEQGSVAELKYCNSYKLKSPYVQIDILSKVFSGAKSYDQKALKKWIVHPYAEGTFAVVDWRIVADTYVEAVKISIGKFKEICAKDPFKYERFLEQSDFNELALTKKTEDALLKISEQQNGSDILMFSAQFGLHHKGRTPNRVLELMCPSEFALDIFSVICMLITHPERLYLQKWEKLDELLPLMCAGNKPAKYYDDKKFQIPSIYRMYHDALYSFDVAWLDYVSSDNAVPTAFLPPRE